MAIPDAGIVLVRHGEGTHNVGDFYSGDPSQPGYVEAHLTESGEQQVIETAQRLRETGIEGDVVLKVICSPLPRTCETLDILIKQLSVPQARLTTDNRLIEAGMGLREGQRISQYNEADSWFPSHPEAFGGETRAQIRQRVVSLFNDLLDQYHDQKGYIILVSHGSPLYLLLEAVTGSPEKLPTAGYKILPLK